MADYTVQAGDTMSKIAMAHGTTVEELARRNNIKNVDRIEIGQELSLGKTQEPSKQAVEQKKHMTGMDGFEREAYQPSATQTYAPLAYGIAGAAAYQGGKYVLPKAKSAAETAQLKYMYAKDAVKSGTKKAAAVVTQKCKETASAVRTFVANKAKHAAKAAELNYAFGKDAVQKGIEKGKNTAKSMASSVSQKAKHAAKAAELNYAFGKDAVQKGAKKAAHKTHVAARYTRFVGNTKVAPKLIKGAGRVAGPLAALYGAYEVKTAYNKGGEKAAVKQAVKTGGGLAGGWAGAKVGAAIGSFAGPVGTVVGGVVGGIAGYFAGEKLCS